MSLPDVLVDPLEALGRERRAGRADGAQRREVAAVAGLDPGLHAGGDVGRARAERGHAGLLGEVPQRAQVRRAGVAVVEHDRRVGEQRADEEVPHHPARGGEPEQAVAVLGVEVQVELLEVLEQDPALPVHDRLRQAGGARRVEDPQRVVEGDAVERELLVGPRERVVPVAVVAEVAEGHRALERRHLPLRRARSARGGRSPCRRSGSRRPPAAPSARSGRSGRPPSARRTPASSSTTPRRGWRPRGTPRSSRGCSACRRRRGRRARPPARAGRRATRAVCSRSSSHVHSPSSRSSEAWRIATRSPGLPRKRCSA